jgi:DNA topoisomerase-1
VARRLGNTPTICRKCYVHPQVLTSYLDGALALEVERRATAELRGDHARLRPEEVVVLAFLRRRLRRGRSSRPKLRQSAPQPLSAVA